MARDAALIIVGVLTGVLIVLALGGFTQSTQETSTVIVRERTVTSTFTERVPVHITETQTMTVWRTTAPTETVTITVTMERTSTITVISTVTPRTPTVTQTLMVTKTVTETMTETVPPSMVTVIDTDTVTDAWPGGWFAPSHIAMDTITSYGYAILEWSSDQQVGWSIALRTENGEFGFQTEAGEQGRVVFPVMPTIEYGLVLNLHNLGENNATVTYTLTLYEIYPSPQE